MTLRHLPFIPERRPVSTGVPSESRVMIGSSPAQLFGPGSRPEGAADLGVELAGGGIDLGGDQVGRPDPEEAGVVGEVHVDQRPVPRPRHDLVDLEAEGGDLVRGDPPDEDQVGRGDLGAVQRDVGGAGQGQRGGRGGLHRGVRVDRRVGIDRRVGVHRHRVGVDRWDGRRLGRLRTDRPGQEAGAAEAEREQRADQPRSDDCGTRTTSREHGATVVKEVLGAPSCPAVPRRRVAGGDVSGR